MWPNRDFREPAILKSCVIKFWSIREQSILFNNKFVFSTKGNTFLWIHILSCYQNRMHVTHTRTHTDSNIDSDAEHISLLLLIGGIIINLLIINKRNVSMVTTIALVECRRFFISKTGQREMVDWEYSFSFFAICESEKRPSQRNNKLKIDG